MVPRNPYEFSWIMDFTKSPTSKKIWGSVRPAPAIRLPINKTEVLFATLFWWVKWATAELGFTSVVIDQVPLCLYVTLLAFHNRNCSEKPVIGNVCEEFLRNSHLVSFMKDIFSFSHTYVFPFKCHTLLFPHHQNDNFFVIWTRF